MGQDLALAFKLLGVGMITVFLILLLVVVLGNLIVFVVNKYFPEAIEINNSVNDNEGSIGHKKMAVIVAAVNIVTKGKGKVSTIEKI
jgi:oxaloacetate decarboxylase gamma subunit